MSKIKLEKAQKAVAAWIGCSDAFVEENPYHALRCAAHALHEAGVLSTAAHDEICWDHLS